MENNIAICNYAITEKLNSSPYTLVYRGIHQDTGKSAILKLPKSKYPRTQELQKIRNEYDIASLFNHNKIISVLGLEEHEHKLVLLREDFDGFPLSQIKKTGAQDLVWFLDIAIQLSEGLREIHRKKVIYKNFSPHNILYRTVTGRIKFIDFSIASVADKDTSYLSDKISPEGTLAYISPEQTGRLEKRMDSRSDLYSLGVTLYQLLTGRLPFATDNPVEILHSHIAKTPPPPHEYDPGIPGTVSKIILKLLEKSADKRYQSCDGLIPDLIKCLIEQKDQQTIIDFSIGQKDVSREFAIPDKLFGRSRELGKVLESFDAIDDGHKKIVFLSGECGIGKTSLVQHALKIIRARGGTIINCKINLEPINLPYQPIIQGFQEAIQEALLTDPDIDKWRASMRATIGGEPHVVTDLFPKLAEILGFQDQKEYSQDPGEHYSSVENKTLFTQVFQGFIHSFSACCTMLVFFIDDMHWLDNESIDLLENIARIPSLNCLFIGTCRNNAIQADHPLGGLVERLQLEGFDVLNIDLPPLSQENVSFLLSESLFHPVEKMRELSELCIQKTAGNPLFLKELLNDLGRSGNLRFDPLNGRWLVDISAVRERKVMENVGEILHRRMEGLSEDSRSILKIASCIGNMFSLSALAALNRKSRQQTLKDLEENIQQGMILHRKPAKHHAAEEPLPEQQDLFRFAHDLIQKTAYELIPEDERPQFHLQVGRILQETLLPEEREQQVFNITSHCNRGSDLLESQSDRLELARLNLKSALKAKAAAAYHSYYRFSQKTLTLLPDNIWQQDYPFAVRCHTEAIEAASLNDFIEETERLFQIIVEHSTDILDKAKAYRIRIQTYFGADRMSEAIDLGREILAEIGFSFPQKPDRFQIMRAMLSIRTALWKKSPEALLELPQMTDELQRIAIMIMQDLAGIAYYTNPGLIPLLSARAIRISLKHGNSLETAIVGYLTYGILLCGLSGTNIESGDHFGRLGLQLAQKMGPSRNQIPVFLYYNFISHWNAPLGISQAKLNEGFQASLNQGYSQIAAHCAAGYCMLLFYQGKNLEKMAKEVSYYVQKTTKLKQPPQISRLLNLQRIITILRDPDGGSRLNESRHSSLEELGLPSSRNSDKTSLFLFHLMNLIMAFLFGNYRLAEACSEKCAHLLKYVLSSSSIPVFHYFRTLTLLSLYPSPQELKWNDLLKEVTSSIENMAKWAQRSPDNYHHKHLLLKAEMFRVEGRFEKAAEYYDLSIDNARESGFLIEEALGLDQAAQFYIQRQRSHIARTYLGDAIKGYRRWAAHSVVHLREKLLETISTTPVRQEGNKEPPMLPYDDKASWVDAASVVKASRTFAGEVVLGDLLRKLITILLENAGGQKAFLLLKIDTDWVVRAKANIDDKAGTLLNASPIVLRHQMSQTIINHVGRTLETVVLNDAQNRENFINDSYITDTKPQSILCMPIIHQGTAIAMLYLENNLTQGAFQPQRLEVLNLIASQAAVSLRNSMLYEELEDTIQKLNKEVGKRKETQIQLMHAGKLSALGRLSASIAHEFGNPLIGIKYLLDDLKNRTALNGEDKKLVELGLEECDRMKRLINDLHDLHRPSSGTRKRFNLNDIANNALLFQRKNLKNASIIVSTDLDPSLPMVRAVEDQITQAVVSLTINAADAMEKDGGTLLLKTSHNEKYVMLEVSDTGCGIPPDYQEHIFEPFFSTKEAADGAGLGLAIAYSIINNHDGKIDFQSFPDEGSTFSIKLPREDGYSYQ